MPIAEAATESTLDFSALLRAAQLRVTKPRLAVLEELAKHPHQSPEALRAAATKRLGAVSVQAIYDVVHTLTAKGILRMVIPAGSLPLFEISHHDNHHHLVCRSCRMVIDIPCVVGEAPCLEPSDDHGFILDEAEVTFWGLCPQCASSKNAVSAGHTTRAAAAVKATGKRDPAKAKAEPADKGKAAPA